MADQPRLAAWLGPLLIAVTFVTLAWWSWRKWADVLVDFPSQLYLPWQLVEGRALYVDIDYKDGPLSQYLNALWFLLFGVSLRTIIWCNLVLLAGLCALVYGIIARACDRFTATLAVLVQLAVFSFSQYTFIGNYNYVCPYAQEQTHGLILSVAMIFCLGECVRRGSVRWSAGAGVALGLVFLTKAELFMPAFGAAVLGLLLIAITLPRDGPRWPRIVLAFMAGAGGAVIVCTALLATQMPMRWALWGVGGNWTHLRGGILKYTFYQVTMGLDDPLTNLELASIVFLAIVTLVAAVVAATWATRRRPLRAMWSIMAGAALGAALIAAAFAIPFIQLGRALPFTSALTLVALVWLVVTRRHDTRGVPFVAPAIWAAFALLLLAKVILNVRISHYGFVLAMPATLLLVATFAWAIPTLLEARLRNGVLARALLVAPIVAFAIYFLQWSNNRYVGQEYQVGAGGDAMITRNPEDDVRGYDLELARNFLQARMPRDATLLTLPEGLILNYWLRRPNPSRHIYFVPWSLDFAGGEAAVLNDIEAHPPDFIAITDRSTEEYGFATFGVDERYGAQIMRWIKRNYRRDRLIGSEPLTGHGFGILIVSRIGLPG